MRAHGAEVAEVPILAVRPELQGNDLGRALLAQLESALLAAGVKLLVLPAVPHAHAHQVTTFLVLLRSIRNMTFHYENPISPQLSTSSEDRQKSTLQEGW